jgi:type II secretion system protein J
MRCLAPGMTLLEVVLAISIVVMMMGGTYAFYTDVLGARDRVVQTAERINAVRSVMSRLTDELDSAKLYPFVNIGLSGQTDRMEFMTVVLPGRAAWALRGLTEEPIPAEHDLQLVGYRLRTTEDDSGEVLVEGLERTCQRRLTATEVEEGQEIELSLMTPHVRFLSLQYWDGSAWTSTWSADSLPPAVRITLGFQPLPEGIEPEEYPYDTFARTVFLPSAVAETGGTIVRGLGGDGP